MEFLSQSWASQDILFRFYSVTHVSNWTFRLEQLWLVSNHERFALEWIIFFTTHKFYWLIRRFLLSYFFLKYLLFLRICTQAWFYSSCWFENIFFIWPFFPKIIYIFPDLLHFLLHLCFETSFIWNSNWLRSWSWLWLLRNSQEIKELNRSWSLFGIEIEAPVNDFLAFFTNFASVRNSIFLDLSENISHIFAIIECFSIQAFIESHS